MSHLTDGELHAWLDGALDELGEAEAARVRAHLAECEACARRLEEERAVRQGAAAILASTAPDVRLPTLEELRSVAATRESRVRSGRRVERVAWAATVVVALGTGWLLRGERSTVPPHSVVPSPESSMTARAEAGEPEAAGPAEAAEQKTARQAVVPRKAGSEPAATPSSVSDEKASADAARARPAVPIVARKVSPDLDSKSSDAARMGQVDTAGSAAKLTATSLAENVDVTAPTSKASMPSLVRTDSVANIAPPNLFRRAGTRDAEAARAGGVAAAPRPMAVPAFGVSEEPRASLEESSRSLAVPGLPVLSVTRLDADGAPGGVRVRQLLMSGDTLELIHLPPNRPPRLGDRAGAGLTELTIPQPDGWLVARARLPRDSLQALVERLGRR